MQPRLWAIRGYVLLVVNLDLGANFALVASRTYGMGTVWIMFDCILDCKIGVRSENFVHGHLTCYDNFRALLKPGRCYFCRIYLPVGKVGGVQGVP